MTADVGAAAVGLPASVSLDTGPMIRFEDLVEKVRAANPDADIELLRRAYVFSAIEHKGQVRRSGEPYLVHPLEVADILADLRLDVVAIAAGLLHDIVEDTPTSSRRSGSCSASRSRTSSRASRSCPRLQFASSEERQAESFRKMLLAMVDDIRVILVKLADRLHNMRTLHYLPEDRRHAHRPGDARHLRADRQPARHEQGEERARGAGVPAISSRRRTRRCAWPSRPSARRPRG